MRHVHLVSSVLLSKNNTKPAVHRSKVPTEKLFVCSLWPLHSHAGHRLLHHFSLIYEPNCSAERLGALSFIQTLCQTWRAQGSEMKVLYISSNHETTTAFGSHHQSQSLSQPLMHFHRLQTWGEDRLPPKLFFLDKLSLFFHT